MNAGSKPASHKNVDLKNLGKIYLKKREHCEVHTENVSNCCCNK